jgi:hypothetical protein
MSDLSEHPVMEAVNGIGIYMNSFASGGHCRHLSGPAYTGSGPVTLQTPLWRDGRRAGIFKLVCAHSQGQEPESGGAVWKYIMSNGWTSHEELDS